MPSRLCGVQLRLAGRQLPGYGQGALAGFLRGGDQLAPGAVGNPRASPRGGTLRRGAELFAGAPLADPGGATTPAAPPASSVRTRADPTHPTGFAVEGLGAVLVGQQGSAARLQPEGPARAAGPGHRGDPSPRAPSQPRSFRCEPLPPARSPPSSPPPGTAPGHAAVTQALPGLEPHRLAVEPSPWTCTGIRPLSYRQPDSPPPEGCLDEAEAWPAPAPHRRDGQRAPQPRRIASGRLGHGCLSSMSDGGCGQLACEQQR